MEVKRVRITNRKQFNLLVERMEEHPSVARGQKFCQATGINREMYSDVWKEMTKALNSLGPPIRNEKDWQKVWADYKSSIKNKLAYNTREAKATGGGPNLMKVLSSTEEAVVKLLSLDKTVNHSGSVFGLHQRVASSSSSTPGPSQPRSTSSPPPLPSSDFEPSMIEEDDQEGNDDEETEAYENGYSSSRPTQRKRRKHNSGDYRQDLLTDQTNCMKKIVEHTEECARYARKMFKLREIEVKQQNEARLLKAKDRKEALEYKLELLKYKKQKLELLERKERKK